jgi:hypothetical protein
MRDRQSALPSAKARYVAVYTRDASSIACPEMPIRVAESSVAETQEPNLRSALVAARTPLQGLA